jgi:hypothetical protein
VARHLDLEDAIALVKMYVRRTCIISASGGDRLEFRSRLGLEGGYFMLRQYQVCCTVLRLLMATRRVRAGLGRRFLHCGGSAVRAKPREELTRAGQRRSDAVMQCSAMRSDAADALASPAWACPAPGILVTPSAQSLVHRLQCTDLAAFLQVHCSAVQYLRSAEQCSTVQCPC